MDGYRHSVPTRGMPLAGLRPNTAKARYFISGVATCRTRQAPTRGRVLRDEKRRPHPIPRAYRRKVKLETAVDRFMSRISD